MAYLKKCFRNALTTQDTYLGSKEAPTKLSLPTRGLHMPSRETFLGTNAILAPECEHSWEVTCIPSVSKLEVHSTGFWLVHLIKLNLSISIRIESGEGR